MTTDRQPLLYLRWALLIGLSYLILDGIHTAEAPSARLAFIAILLGSNVVLPRWIRNLDDFRATRAILALDTILVVSGIGIFARPSEDLFIGYFLCILLAIFADSPRRLVGTAFLTMGIYGLWLFRGWQAPEMDVLLRFPLLFVISIFYGYMIQRLRTEQRHRRAAEIEARGLGMLLRLTREFSASLDSRAILDRLEQTIREALGVPTCHAHLVDEAEDAVSVDALRTRNPVTRYRAENGKPAATLLALPLVYDLEPLGVLVIETDNNGEPFVEEEIEFCQLIANAAAAALKNARQYERVTALEKSRSEFLANLSHEVRTPLHAILGFTELARDVAEGPVADFVDRISTNAATMSTHVENLLRLSNLTMGREERELRRTDVSGLVTHAVERATRLNRSEAVRFESYLAPGVGEVLTDGDKLERILDCILMNAVRFTKQGSIQVSASILDVADGETLPSGARPWERVLALSVADTGIGIPEGDLARIFDAFEKGDGSSTSPWRGLGLGLTVSRRLAELLGGTVRVESRAGEGSVFRVLIPVQPA